MSGFPGLCLQHQGDFQSSHLEESRFGFKNYALAFPVAPSHRTRNIQDHHTFEVEPALFHAYSQQDHPPSLRVGQQHRCLPAGLALRVLPQWDNATSHIESLFTVSAPDTYPQQIN
jgi:hypothetical protein